MDWLYRISITCFAASYLVALALEISRAAFKSRYRRPAVIGFTIAGLFAHTAYLVYQGSLEINDRGIWMSNWTAWCFAAAWILAAAYLWVALRKSESAIGIFLLPMVLLLIGTGIWWEGAEPFSAREAKSGWNLVHGYSLMLGTVSVALGFVFGLIYLVQANRLKQKKHASARFRLPSLEWLQRCSERTLLASTLLLALGLTSGIAINLINQNRVGNTGTIAWSDPVVWSTGILFTWLLAILIFNTLYRPARQGRKVAYLVVSSFLFLIFELAIVWLAGHASTKQPTARHGMVSPAIVRMERPRGLRHRPSLVSARNSEAG